MDVILYLYRTGYLSAGHVEIAERWRQEPTKLFLAPSMFCILHDAIFKGLGCEEIEVKRGLPSRAAKSIIRLLLTALQECNSIFIRLPIDAEEEWQSEREMLLGRDVSELSTVMGEFGLSPMLARLLIILRSWQGRAVPFDAVYARLYAGRYDDAPDMGTVKVHVFNLNKKLRARGLRVETVRGIGWRLINHEI